MKKILAFFLVALSSSVFSQNNYFYCPSEIVCTEAGSEKSCGIQGGDQENFVRILSVTRVNKAKYKLKEVHSLYDSLHNRNPSYCIYMNTDSGYEKKILLATPLVKGDLPFAEAVDYGQNSKWQVEDGSATCKSSSPQDCPLHMVQQ